MNKVERNNVKEGVDLDGRMRILANFLIDRYLEDKKNNRLQSILKPPNINLDQKDNNGNT